MSSLKIWLLLLLFCKLKIDSFQQSVPAAIIQNSAVENVSHKKRQKQPGYLDVGFHANFVSKLF
jgi:hypothetical protein